MQLSSPAVRKVISETTIKAQSLGLPLGAARRVAMGSVFRYVSTRATVAGFQDAFLFGAMLVGVSLAAVFLLPKHLVSHVSNEPVGME
jgi:hypothetical protein